MNMASNAQGTAIHIGVLLVGALCLLGAVQQWRTGETYGLSGKGRVTRDEEPGYFHALGVARVVLGSLAVLLGLLVPW